MHAVCPCNAQCTLHGHSQDGGWRSSPLLSGPTSKNDVNGLCKIGHTSTRYSAGAGFITRPAEKQSSRRKSQKRHERVTEIHLDDGRKVE